MAGSGFNFRFKGQAKEKVQGAFRKALTTVANEIKEDFIKATGKPVTVWRGQVRRSRPGENPRRESGRFNKSMKFRTSAEEKKDAMVIWSDDEKHLWLEKGTEHMEPRPSFQLLWAKWQKKLKARVREVMKQDLG